jgi:hypothetical protein
MVVVPEVIDKAVVLVKGDKMLLAGAEGIVNQPVDFVDPKDEPQR